MNIKRIHRTSMISGLLAWPVSTIGCSSGQMFPSTHAPPCSLPKAGLVENVPAVVLTTKDGWYCGKGKFDFFVDVASTHGSLNYSNSVTFAMSTAGELPEVLRLTDLRPALKDLGLNPP